MRVASAGRGFKSRGGLLLLHQLAGCPHQQRRKIRLPRAVFAPKLPATRTTKVIAARAPMAGGGGERPRVPAGAAGLAVWATLLCNAASLAYFLRSYVVDGSRRRRRGCAARSGADDVALQPEDGGELRPEGEDPDHAVALAPDAVLNLELCAPARPSFLATPRRAAAPGN